IVHILHINHERMHFGKDVLGVIRSCRWRCRKLLFEDNCLAHFAANLNEALDDLLFRSPQDMSFHVLPRYLTCNKAGAAAVDRQPRVRNLELLAVGHLDDKRHKRLPWMSSMIRFST